jgi:hypothetical protein
MSLEWERIRTDLDAGGYAILPGLVAPHDCADLIALYDDEPKFRKHVVMARHGFGQGEYKYFGDPLPAPVQHLRTSLYPKLAGIANEWSQALGWEVVYPATHAAYRELCHSGGQTSPTPLLLRYGPGDFNCLHQDLYGDLVFPLQVAVLLSAPGTDFEGGEFVLVEQRPRQQSRAEVVPLRQGDAVVFTVNSRPVKGSRGFHRVAMRHGVSRIRAGSRHTLGVIFHDAK